MRRLRVTNGRAARSEKDMERPHAVMMRNDTHEDRADARLPKRPRTILEQCGPDAEIGDENHDGNSEHRQNHMAHMRKGLGVAQILLRLGKLFRLTTQRFATRVGIPPSAFHRHVPWMGGIRVACKASSRLLIKGNCCYALTGALRTGTL